MADSKITKKHHPTGSLAFRILNVSIVLLVIPLFFQSLLLYREEYKEKLIDVEEDLEVLARERAHLIEEMIRMNRTLLEVVSSQNEDIFQKHFVRSKDQVKPLYIRTIPLPFGVRGDFAMLNSPRDAIVVGRQESETSALITRIPMAVIIRAIGTSIPVHISLVDSKEKEIPADDSIEVQEPIKGTEIFLNLRASKALIHGLHVESYYLRFASLLFFVGIIGGGAVYFFIRRIARPLNQLCETMRRVEEGAAHARYKSDKWGFEINELGLQFNETLDGLLAHAEDAEKEKLARGKLAAELRIGHNIQASLLPSHPPGFLGLDIGAGYFAAKEVNGDFYDLFKLNSGKLLIVICDSAGKGVSGCLYSIGLRSMIRSFATVTPNLSKMVQLANDLFWLDAHETSMFSTLWVGLYDPKTSKLTYCSQGHPPAILKRSDQLLELGTDGIALGAQKIDVIPTKEIKLMQDDLLVLYTDGITEAHNQENQLFGKKRLEEFILSKNNETATQITDQLVEEVHQFSCGASQYDDMTLVAIRVVDRKFKPLYTQHDSKIGV